MAENHQINGGGQGLQYQHHGHDAENNGNHQPTEAQELDRPIVPPGNNDYQLILPDFIADIPKKLENSEYNIKLGIHATEINRHQQDGGNILRAALLDFNYLPNG